MPGMDIFGTDPAFSMIELTAALNDRPHVPGRIGEMSLFEEEGVTTTTVAVEKQNNTIALVPTTPRGAPPTQNTPDRRNIRHLEPVRLAQEDVIFADQIQNVRGFGSMSAAQSLAAEVNRRNARMALNLDVTLEHHRIGAIKGNVLDADGTTVLYDLFTLFEVSAQSTVDWNLDNGTPTDGELRTLCSQNIRLIEDELGGLPYSSMHCFTSALFFDQLVAHPEVRESFLHSEGERLRERTARRSLHFAGIDFEEYRGKVGAVSYIADGACHMFPVGVPGNFITRFAPADYNDTVNTMGLPRYARTFADTERQRFQALEVQSNPLTICTRPRTLLPGTNT